MGFKLSLVHTQSPSSSHCTLMSFDYDIMRTQDHAKLEQKGRSIKEEEGRGEEGREISNSVSPVTTPIP